MTCPYSTSQSDDNCSVTTETTVITDDTSSTTTETTILTATPTTEGGTSTAVTEEDDQIVKECAVCGLKEHLSKCSRCKKIMYCSLDCQKKDWKKHKSNCGPSKTVASSSSTSAPNTTTTTTSAPSSKSNSQTVSTGSGKCPYRPKDVSDSSEPKSCPFRDAVEEAQLQTMIDKYINDGLSGMVHLSHLAKSGEMIIQIPLQQTIERVLNMIEAYNHQARNIPISYMTECGQFIVNMIQWVENEEYLKTFHSRLLSLVLKFLDFPLAEEEISSTFRLVFCNMLFRLYIHDRNRIKEQLAIMKSHSQFVSSIGTTLQREEWKKLGAAWVKFGDVALTVLSE